MTLPRLHASPTISAGQGLTIPIGVTVAQNRSRPQPVTVFERAATAGGKMRQVESAAEKYGELTERQPDNPAAWSRARVPGYEAG